MNGAPIQEQSQWETIARSDALHQSCIYLAKLEDLGFVITDSCWQLPSGE